MGTKYSKVQLKLEPAAGVGDLQTASPASVTWSDFILLTHSSVLTSLALNLTSTVMPWWNWWSWTLLVEAYTSVANST